MRGYGEERGADHNGRLDSAVWLCKHEPYMYAHSSTFERERKRERERERGGGRERLLFRNFCHNFLGDFKFKIGYTFF